MTTGPSLSVSPTCRPQLRSFFTHSRPRLQTRHDATLLHLRVEHERALSTSSVLTMQDELNQLRTSLTTAVAEARAEATRTAQQVSVGALSFVRGEFIVFWIVVWFGVHF